MIKTISAKAEKYVNNHHPIMKDYFRRVNNITANLIYIPEILRGDIPIIINNSGTRLSTNKSKQ